ncbi:hypothetical protein SKAU_G00299020 [Synaphobranchus kaupii]|uniref:Uncharacterized protein n=1 Tax=Synaphobranchus kaupii TaxID=118154 RepID=A0A9Q1EVD1_SYNKA|nr:hypothetical protein SKAU_G00299020 [Synaphobranchus kaupii]
MEAICIERWPACPPACVMERLVPCKVLSDKFLATDLTRPGVVEVRLIRSSYGELEVKVQAARPSDNEVVSIAFLSLSNYIERYAAPDRRRGGQEGHAPRISMNGFWDAWRMVDRAYRRLVMTGRSNRLRRTQVKQAATCPRGTQKGGHEQRHGNNHLIYPRLTPLRAGPIFCRQQRWLCSPTPECVLPLHPHSDGVILLILTLIWGP